MTVEVTDGRSACLIAQETILRAQVSIADLAGFFWACNVVCGLHNDIVSSVHV
jgi:hypothetical protein